MFIRLYRVLFEINPHIYVGEADSSEWPTAAAARNGAVVGTPSESMATATQKQRKKVLRGTNVQGVR